MPKIEQWIIEKVKDAADIVDVVGDFVDLRKAGVNYTGCCPFHDDQHDGNFIVRPKGAKVYGNTYHCFVCMKQGEGGGPVDFLMQHEKLSFADAIRWLGKKYSIEVDNVPLNYTQPPPRPKPKPLPPLTFKRETVIGTFQGAEATNLVRWLYTLPWTEEQRTRLGNVLYYYCVGACPNGPEWVRFWQISHEGVAVTAKWMRYKTDGHRVKDKNPDGTKVYATDWEHAWRARQGQYDQNKYDVSGRTLFGAHMLRRYPEAVVNIVESEKTAIIMATFYGHPESQLWLACGGLQQMRLEIMQPLIDQGRTVWLWPDKDGREAWQEVADKLGSDKVNVYTTFFDTCWREADGDKADCADITIRMMMTGDQPRKETHTGDPQPPTTSTSGGSAAATPETQTIAGIDCVTVDPYINEPFLDPEELADPRIREWREILRNKYNFNKRRNNDWRTNTD